MSDWTEIGEVYETRLERIVAMVRRYVRDDATARDLAQDAFLRAMERQAQFGGGASLSTWITSIALNGARDHVRRERRRRHGVLSADFPSRADGPFAAACVRELEGNVARAVAALPPLLARAYAGESGGAAPVTIRVRLHLARRELRRRLAVAG